MAQFPAGNTGSPQLREARVQIRINMAVDAGAALKDPFTSRACPCPSRCVGGAHSQLPLAPRNLFSGITALGLVCLLHLSLSTWGARPAEPG